MDIESTPPRKEPLAPRAKPRTATPLASFEEKPGIRLLQFRPGNPASGTPPPRPRPAGTTPKPVQLITPHKPYKFKNQKMNDAWVTYNSKVSQLGGYSIEHLMKNPETYAEYLTELKSADVLAKRWNFEPVIPKFVRADEKTDIEAKLKELDKIVLTEQRNMEQDLFDTQTKQKKEEQGLTKSKEVIAGANKKIDILRTEERRKTGTDLKRTQNSIESMRRFIQRQEKRVMISENKISGFRRTLTEIQKNHKTIQNRKKNIQDALKKIKTATPGMDLSRVHSAHQRRHENPPSSAPRRLETPQPTHSARQLRGAARSGPAATSKKVDALQKKRTRVWQNLNRAKMKTRHSKQSLTALSNKLQDMR
jgi:hypothetical protein